MKTSTPHLFTTMILSSLFTFSSCTEEFDDCFYLTDEIITKIYPLDNFNQFETFVPEDFEKQEDLNITLSKKSFLDINQFKGTQKFFMLYKRGCYDQKQYTLRPYR